MKEIIVNNQAEYDAIPDDFGGLVIIMGRVRIERILESASVVAYGSASVRASGSASVRAY